MEALIWMNLHGQYDLETADIQTRERIELEVTPINMEAWDNSIINWPSCLRRGTEWKERLRLPIFVGAMAKG
jgi:hypothetical protein